MTSTATCSCIAMRKSVVVWFRAKRETIAGLPANEYYRQYRDKRKNDPVWRAKRYEHNKTYRENHPETVHEQERRRQLRKYNLTREGYEWLLQIQGGVCAACGGEQHSSHRYLFVDHDHETEEVRGLLCNACTRR